MGPSVRALERVRYGLADYTDTHIHKYP